VLDQWMIDGMDAHGNTSWDRRWCKRYAALPPPARTIAAGRLVN